MINQDRCAEEEGPLERWEGNSGSPEPQPECGQRGRGRSVRHSPELVENNAWQRSIMGGLTTRNLLITFTGMEVARNQVSRVWRLNRREQAKEESVDDSATKADNKINQKSRAVAGGEHGLRHLFT